MIRVKLKHLDSWSKRRVENARKYDACFDGSVVTPPTIAPANASIYNQYVIAVPRRDALREHLTNEGIGTEVYYPVPLHLQDCFADLGGRPGDLPNCEKVAQEVVALPIYPELPPAALQRVAQAILSFYASGV